MMSGFLRTLLKSFTSPQSYPELARRSGWSSALHYATMIVLMSCLYAGVTTFAVHAFLQEFAPSFLGQVPDIQIRNGVASSEPRTIKYDEVEIIIDTDQDARAHAEDGTGIIILGKTNVLVKKPSGEIREYPLKEVKEADFSASKLSEWLGMAELWTFPICAFFVALWQGIWKLIQVLFVAGVVTLIVSGRPGFGTCLKLTLYALGPAMLWGVLVYGVSLLGFDVPMAALGFYALLGGIPLWAAREMQARELRLQRADFVPPQDL